jgi:predicted hydrocarbon binding protein
MSTCAFTRGPGISEEEKTTVFMFGLFAARDAYVTAESHTVKLRVHEDSGEKMKKQLIQEMAFFLCFSMVAFTPLARPQDQSSTAPQSGCS